MGGHDLHRNVDEDGRVFVRCRKCFGNSTQCLRREVQDVCKPNDA